MSKMTTQDLGKYIVKEKVLIDLGVVAKYFAEIMELELSGERDGNGTWMGSDVLDAALRESVPNIRLLSELYLQAEEAEQVEQAESNVDEIIF
jgi:uncharacterized linocin/CFP29 family protein